MTLSAILHEGGHALYESGLPAEDFGTPLGTYCSFAIHESQSRWWECFIGQSRCFSDYLLSKLPTIWTDFHESQTNNRFRAEFRNLRREDPIRREHVPLHGG
ncbi:MAG: hypothetical protein AAGE99_05430 [Chlamydiota bacterium]